MKVAIIGAGFTGLSAAFDLVQAGDEVTIFDSGNFAGGLASGFKEDHWNWSVEKFYHHWFESDKAMLKLLADMDVMDNVLFPRPYTVMYHDGSFYPMDSIINAIKFPGLGWGLDKIRFGLVGLFLRISTNWKTLEKYTVADWMRKWAGRHVYELMWEPLVVGKFGREYAEQVNMAWLWARLHARTTRLGTYKGGFQAFADELTRQLTAKGVNIHFNKRIEKIESVVEGGYTIKISGNPERYDQVLVTTSPAIAERLIPELPVSYLEKLRELRSIGALVLAVSLDRQLSKEGYYWYNIPKNEGFPFLAIVEHTNYVSAENFGGDHIVYIGDYLAIDHPNYQLDRQRISELYLSYLKKINPDFELSWVKKTWLHKADYAQPVPLLDHSKNIPDVRTPCKGVYFASMSHIYPWDRGTNFAVKLGRETAEMMTADRNKA